MPGAVAVVDVLPPYVRTSYMKVTVDLSKHLPAYDPAAVGSADPAGMVFDRLLVDAFFFCGPLQSNCPIWDQLGFLYVCPSDTECWEVTRWVSAYRRKGGWVTDITPLLGLLTSPPLFERRNVTFLFNFRNLYFPVRCPHPCTHPTPSLCAWSCVRPPTWPCCRSTRLADASDRRACRCVQTIRLLFLDTGRPEVPTAAVTPLWSGGVLDLNYNPTHPPMDIPVPNSTNTSAAVSSLMLAAFITGHGWGLDVHDCAEFCVTEVRHTWSSSVRPSRLTLTRHAWAVAAALLPSARVWGQQPKHVRIRAQQRRHPRRVSTPCHRGRGTQSVWHLDLRASRVVPRRASPVAHGACAAPALEHAYALVLVCVRACSGMSSCSRPTSQLRLRWFPARTTRSPTVGCSTAARTMPPEWHIRLRTRSRHRSRCRRTLWRTRAGRNRHRHRRLAPMRRPSGLCTSSYLR